jgi:hypothetical protein
MIKKVLVKAVAGTATAGVMLVPVAGTVAPQVANVACRYPDTVSTSMNIHVDKAFQRQGERNYARMTVRSGAGAPTGTVSFRIHTVKKVQYAKLKNGKATFRIPSSLKAGRTYGISSIYFGQCKFRKTTDTAFVSVFKKKGRR